MRRMATLYVIAVAAVKPFRRKGLKNLCPYSLRGQGLLDSDYAYL